MATNTFTYTELTNQDKINIVKNRIKNLEYSIFDLGLAIAEAEASNTADIDVPAINLQISAKQSQVQVFKDIINSLEA